MGRYSSQLHSQSLSQASTSKSKRQRVVESPTEEIGNNSTFEADVNNLVRFFITRGTEYKFLKKNFTFLSSQKNLDDLIERAEIILDEVYGLEIIVCDESPKTYILHNTLKEFDVGNTEEQDKERIILFLVLAHILLSKNKVGDDSLYSFLQQFGIDVNAKHKDFGMVKDLLSKFAKQGFIDISTDTITRKSVFTWGARANREISKKKLLKLVCEIYNDGRKVESWGSQFVLE